VEDEVRWDRWIESGVNQEDGEGDTKDEQLPPLDSRLFASTLDNLKLTVLKASLVREVLSSCTALTPA